MKLLALFKKEAKDILSNKIYLLVVFVQLLIILGAYGLAITSSVVTDPELLDEWGGSATIKVGLPQNLQGSPLEESLKNQDLTLMYFPDVETGLKEVGREVVALVYISNEEGDIGLQIDNTNVFYPVARDKINTALDYYQLEEILSSRRLSTEEINIIQNPLDINEIKINKESASPLALDSSYFVEIMYGFIVPFILLLPFFLASNIVTDSVVGEKERKTFEVLLMTPLSGPMVIAGKILPILLFSLIQSGAWIMLLYFLQVPVYNPLLLMVLLFFVGLGFIGMGVLISMLVDSTKEANSAVTLLLFFATFVLFLPLFMNIPALSGILNTIPTVIIVRMSSGPYLNPLWILEFLPSVFVSLAIFALSIFYFKQEGAIRL
ncbi:MAG: ABC transporter permease [Euryarchaeota archaeon]|nr:ABC transporter permease [Euryarchaeota archaeon]MBV1729543.1 ABC transporter permease [Methanobacterium sp.]MBU4548222.1 ABC transporter permease [Euryarchaeota archaeon]MBU4607749.1 ABC transporter permease [Euryarchaeota archaeon]MBV1754035.1 ABC transporter permease [Methanobacterium sp.]